MCKSIPEGGQRCRRHLKDRIARLEEEQEVEAKRLYILNLLKKFVEEFSGPYGKAVAAFREKYTDLGGFQLPNSMSKLKRDIDQAARKSEWCRVEAGVENIKLERRTEQIESKRRKPLADAPEVIEPDDSDLVGDEAIEHFLAHSKADLERARR
ncbi:hypothetical protein Lsed01_00867 [Demequina sediminis]|uniref:Uncharacterized protein n=1 Tax=Demequina sediminis TaxID=1930058 RepID=A0ABP9WF22_9MICO|nr:hypothetical protein [Demequina sediminis]BDZ62479.1 hypothetical protein GCM10025873_22700 [Demequina sediminis]